MGLSLFVSNTACDSVATANPRGMVHGLLNGFNTLHGNWPFLGRFTKALATRIPRCCAAIKVRLYLSSYQNVLQLCLLIAQKVTLLNVAEEKHVLMMLVVP